MEDLVWAWDYQYEGSVPKGEHPIITLGKAGLVFTIEEDGVNINRMNEALKTDGTQKRSVYIQIQIIDEVNLTREEVN